MATVNANGASVRTLREYLDDITQRYLNIDPGWNLNSESPDGNAIEIWSETMANADEAVIRAFDSVDPRSAVGVQLDRIARFAELERQAGTFSTVQVDLTGTSGTVVPEGTEFRNTETDTLWASDVEVTLDAQGQASVGTTCTTSGPEPAAIGDISEIATPVSGLSSVNNPQAASLGQAEESDAEFRVRRRNSVARASDNQVDTIFSLVANTDGVNRAKVYENPESTTDANGLGPHSIMILADGGDPADIAAEIASAKNPGTSLNRNESFANKVNVDTTTPSGNPLNVTFFRPVSTTIYVDVDVTGDLPSGIDADIKDAIVEFANADLFDTGTEGFDQLGFTIGDVVSAGKLYTPVNRVIGSGGYVTQIQIGTSSGSVNQTTVDPGFNGLAVFNTDNITVTISGP